MAILEGWPVLWDFAKKFLSRDLRTGDTNKLFSKILKITTEVLFILIKWIVLTAQILIFHKIFTKMVDKVTKICMGLYRKLKKSRVLNIIEGVQVPNILEICYLYNLQSNYVKKYTV
jgi:hypothetical protein